MSSWGRREDRVPPEERAAILERDDYICQLQYPQCCAGIATVVDHIISLGISGPGRDPENLQAACAPCHARKTEAERLAGVKAKAAHRRARLKLPQPQKHPGEM